VEIIGSSDPFYDALVIFMAVRAMKTAGIEEFIIELGQVGFSERLMELTGLPEDDLSVLKDMVDSKDSFGVEEFLSGKSVSKDAEKLLLELPDLSGGEEMLRKLRGNLKDENLCKAVDGLLEILGILDDFGVLQYISVDLGMVRRIDYYTGMIFRGLTYGMGFPVLSGGRYDDLCSSFNRDMPATGFSISIDLALAALYRNGLSDSKNGRNGTLICFGSKGRKDALMIAAALQEQGVSAELYPADNEKEAIAYAGEWGLDGLILTTGNGSIESIDMKTGEKTKSRLESLSGGAS
jgi:ATP phosphoribosyltransferase regulatory subunit